MKNIKIVFKAKNNGTFFLKKCEVKVWILNLFVRGLNVILGKLCFWEAKEKVHFALNFSSWSPNYKNLHNSFFGEKSIKNEYFMCIKKNPQKKKS